MQNGYGLTETSPVIAARRPRCNVSNVYNELKFLYHCVPMCLSVHLHKNCLLLSLHLQ